MKNLKLLFINPCLRKGSSYKVLPVGLASVMTYVASRGYTFDLLDIDVHEYDDAFVEEYIKNSSYDVILYGSIITHYKWIKWLTKTIKHYHPETKVVVGNSVAGSCYEVFLNNAPADVVVIGEGEYSCAETLDAFRDNTPLAAIPGIAFRSGDGTLVKTSRRKACVIDELPMVDWRYFEVERYFDNTKNKLSFGQDEGSEQSQRTVTMPVSTARGCICKCTFCHYVFWDDPYRFRSPSSVLQEVKRNMECYGANYINFWDDLSFASLGQLEAMCDAILASGLKFNWSAAIRTDLLGNPEKPLERRLAVTRKMKEAGCSAVGFSLESGNAEILAMMKKRVKTEYFAEQIKILHQVGITCNVSVIFGYPIETRDTMHETFDMCLANGIYPSIGFLLPLPYTGMYEYALKHGFITDEDAFLSSITERQDICLNMTTLSNEEILAEIKACAQRANEVLNLGLDEKSLVKTGGYKRHTNIKKQLADTPDENAPEKPQRNENDFSFSYSQAVFKGDNGKSNDRSIP